MNINTIIRFPVHLSCVVILPVALFDLLNSSVKRRKKLELNKRVRRVCECVRASEAKPLWNTAPDHWVLSKDIDV